MPYPFGRLSCSSEQTPSLLPPRSAGLSAFSSVTVCRSKGLKSGIPYCFMRKSRAKDNTLRVACQRFNRNMLWQAERHRVRLFGQGSIMTLFWDNQARCSSVRKNDYGRQLTACHSRQTERMPSNVCKHHPLSRYFSSHWRYAYPQSFGIMPVPLHPEESGRNSFDPILTKIVSECKI